MAIAAVIAVAGSFPLWMKAEQAVAGGQADVNGPGRNEPVVAQGTLALYHPGGMLVSSFGSGGLVQTAAASAAITTLGIDASGDIFTLPDAEFSPAGQLDSSVTAEPITVRSHGGAGAFLINGDSMIAGTVGTGTKPISFEADMRSFTAAGQPVPGFQSTPFRYDGSTSATGQDAGNAIAITPAGQIIVAGSERTPTSVSFGVERLNANGTPDTTFGNAPATPIGENVTRAESARSRQVAPPWQPSLTVISALGKIVE